MQNNARSAGKGHCPLQASLGPGVRRSRLSSCRTGPERHKVSCIAPVAKFTGHRIGTLFLQLLSLSAQLPTFQEKQIIALTLVALGFFNRLAVS
jgi:hypothetical protein